MQKVLAEVPESWGIPAKLITGPKVRFHFGPVAMCTDGKIRPIGKL